MICPKISELANAPPDVQSVPQASGGIVSISQSRDIDLEIWFCGHFSSFPSTALVDSKSLQNWPNQKHLLIVSPLTLTGLSAPKDRPHSIEDCHVLSPTRRQRSATSQVNKRKIRGRNVCEDTILEIHSSVSEFSERNQTYQCKHEANKGPGG